MQYWDDSTIEKIRQGYFSAVYFNRTKEILLSEKNLKGVTMQIFQKNEGSILCGIEPVMELFRKGTGLRQLAEDWVDKSSELEILSLHDGDKMSSWETAMHISGPYVYFAHLESVYLGILARSTMIATNVKKAVDASNGKSVIFFADRFDYFMNQQLDGYAAKTGGASGVCTPAHTEWWGGEAAGTMPHALIALYDGNTVEAVKKYAQYAGDSNVIALVDFENDCVRTSLEVARALGDTLWGVRLDTSEKMVDESLRQQATGSRQQFNGVNPELVKLVRKALDQEGFEKVKIAVSGGFYDEKITRFEAEGAPVDVYGVGAALVHGANDFTADIVRVEGKDIAKKGREYRENNKLRSVI
jgi:nicotinate phosphoribosyltransferase